MKDALRQLPLEVWVDVFRYPWASRDQFGKMVADIGNYAFARSAQFYLHDWGRRTLPKFIYFDQRGLYIDGPGWPIYLGIPQTPLPSNIRYMGNIIITHSHSEIVEFLDKVRPLLTHLELDVARVSPDRLEDLRTFLTGPFLDGTQSLWCKPHSLPVVQQCFSREKMAEINVIKYYREFFKDNIDEALMQQNVNLVVNWLTQPDGLRLCDFRACPNNNGFKELISMAVREQFSTAKDPCMFAVNLNLVQFPLQFAEFHLKNNIGEELHGVWTDDGISQITRHPANFNTEMLQEWIKEVTKRHTHNRIAINLGPSNQKSLLERMVGALRAIIASIRRVALGLLN